MCSNLHTYINLRVCARNPDHVGPLNVGNQNKSEANEFFQEIAKFLSMHKAIIGAVNYSTARRVDTQQASAHNV